MMAVFLAAQADKAILPTKFATRQLLIDHVAKLCPWAEGQASTEFVGGHEQAHTRLQKIDPINYTNTRNYHDGYITKLSPYITHGMIDLNTVRNHALRKMKRPEQATKFIQELAWRDFWQHMLTMYPNWAWQDIEAYKTGWQADDYNNQLPEDIYQGATGVAAIDGFIKILRDTGYLHNHARMYLASYIVHFRRVKWQAGAKWFLSNLLDGDVASNNLSWQWIASTFSAKPYIFNLENVEKYFSGAVDTSFHHNKPLASDYDVLKARLFPHLLQEIF